MTIHPLARFFRWLLADPSLAAHLARGAAGLSAIVFSFTAPWNAAWPALILLPLAQVMLRGCPMCWVHGTVCALPAKCSPSTNEEGN